MLQNSLTLLHNSSIVVAELNERVTIILAKGKNMANGNRPTGFDPEKPMFTINVVADLLEVHPRTLRIYDEGGLLVPHRTPKNRRIYSFNNIEQGRFIQFMTRELGINIAGVKIIFELKKHINKSSGDSYRSVIERIVKDLNITPEQQEENKKKFGKKGRKPNRKVKECALFL